MAFLGVALPRMTVPWWLFQDDFFGVAFPQWLLALQCPFPEPDSSRVCALEQEVVSLPWHILVLVAPGWPWWPQAGADGPGLARCPRGWGSCSLAAAAPAAPGNPHPPAFPPHLLPSLCQDPGEEGWQEGPRGLSVTSPCPPACNVTIHNRCKDTLPNCTKVKQKVSAGGAGAPRGLRGRAGDAGIGDTRGQ